MARSTSFRSGLGLLVALCFLLFPSAAVWGEHHEQEGQKEETHEPTEEKVLHLAQELADLLERGVQLYQTAEPQDTVLQQRQRDAAKGALLRARDAALVFVKTLEGGGSVSGSDSYLQMVEENMRAALETAGNAEPSSEAARVLERLDEIVRELGRIYDQS